MPSSRPPPSWPGQVFAPAERPYAECMQLYVVHRAAQHRRRRGAGPRGGGREAQQRLAEAEQALCAARRHQRGARRASDASWREAKRLHALQAQQWAKLRKVEREAQTVAHAAEHAEWRARLAARRAEVAQRRAEDQLWRQARHALRDQHAQLQPTTPLVPLWLAMLVVIDNCTRRCLGLVVLTEGAHTSAESVVAALRPHLPPTLAFVISDNGSQFTAEAFAALARQASFVHVRTAPHRPCTNGIAERFVQTLKGLLSEQAWQDADDLVARLPACQSAYNQRPHQAAELRGLSPNEYARRLQACATC